MRRSVLLALCVCVMMAMAVTNAQEEDDTIIVPVEDAPVGLNAPVFVPDPQYAVMPPLPPYVGDDDDVANIVAKPPMPTAANAGEEAPANYIL
jgi:hypothetical protein